MKLIHIFFVSSICEFIQHFQICIIIYHLIHFFNRIKKSNDSFTPAFDVFLVFGFLFEEANFSKLRAASPFKGIKIAYMYSMLKKDELFEENYTNSRNLTYYLYFTN